MTEKEKRGCKKIAGKEKRGEDKKARGNENVIRRRRKKRG